MPKTAYHINEVLKLMDKARDEGATVNLKAWSSEGEVIDYNGWSRAVPGVVDSIAWLTR